MRRLITNCFLFLSIVVATVYLVGSLDNIDKNNSNNHNIKKLQTAYLFDSLDALFIGNSYCYSSVNTNLLFNNGINSYNLGIATAGPLFCKIVIEDYLKHIKSPPKTIYILLSPLTFSSKGDNFDSYPIHRYLLSPITNEELSLKYALESKYLSLIKKSFKKGCLNLRLITHQNNVRNKDQNRGFYGSTVVNNSRITKESESHYMSLKTEDWDTKKGEDFFEFIKYIEKKNIEIVFFETPTNLLPNYLNSKFISKYNILLKKIKLSHTFIESNIKYENKLFRNIDHMNSSGAELFTYNLLLKIKASHHSAELEQE